MNNRRADRVNYYNGGTDSDDDSISMDEDPFGCDGENEEEFVPENEDEEDTDEEPVDENGSDEEPVGNSQPECDVP